MRYISKFIIPTLILSFLVSMNGTTVAQAAVPAAAAGDKIQAIPADGALWASVLLNGSGGEISSAVFEATSDATSSPAVVSTCTATFAATQAPLVKRCKLSGLTNGVSYFVRVKLANADGDTGWLWSTVWNDASTAQGWTPSATAVKLFGSNLDCSYWPNEVVPCHNANVDTTVTMTGQNLQLCTFITSMGGGGAAIPITPASDGSSITFTIPSGRYGWANFNCGLGTPGGFLGNTIQSFNQWTTPSWSQYSGSTAGGDVITIKNSSWGQAVFNEVSSVTLQGNPVSSYTVVDMYTMRITIPAGTAGSADLVVINSNGTGTQSGVYTYTAPAAPGTPNAPTVEASNGKVTITPVDSGTGGTPTSFTVTASPGGATCTVTLPATSCEINGLNNGTAYTFTTTATNSGGTSGSSSASSPVTPSALISTNSSLAFVDNDVNDGDKVSVTSTITGTSGTTDPTGTVDWFYCYNASNYPGGCAPSSGTALSGHTGASLSAGTPNDATANSAVANFDAPEGVGYYLFRAEYSGDSTYSSSWQTVALRVQADVAPGAPGTPTGTVGDGYVDLEWSTPSTGTAPFSYTITSSPLGATCSITGTTATCTGLTNGTAYTFTVTASNGAGSQDSIVSSSITPEAAGSGGGSSGSSKAKYKPVKPFESEVEVSQSKGSLRFGLNYSGSNSYKPSSYIVRVLPSGNTCVAYGASSSCEIIGLKAGVEYTVSIKASNGFGNSPELVLTEKYILGENGLLKFVSKKSLSNFAGDSAKLTKAFKLTIKNYLKQNTSFNAVTCTGYTAGKPVLKSDKELAKARAKAVCGFVQKLQPSLTTTIAGKTPGLAWGPKNRKVLIRGFSDISQ